MLFDYEDEDICDFLEFGFPLGYFGDVQRWSEDSYSLVKNHGDAKNFPAQMQKYLLKEQIHDAILGPFPCNPFCCNIALLRSSSEDRILRILTRFEIMWLIEHAVIVARLLT